MSLLDDFKEECVLIEKTRISDGEGGFITKWVEGAHFLAAVTLDTTTAARKAYQEGMTSVYTVTTTKAAALDFHDVFKRSSDGAIFRVTSNGKEKHSPARASFDIAVQTAEMWRLTE